MELAGAEPDAAARRESRPIYWSPKRGYEDTPIYDYDQLLPGNEISGPAILESPETTYVVEPGWVFTMDAYRNCIMEQGGKS